MKKRPFNINQILEVVKGGTDYPIDKQMSSNDLQYLRVLARRKQLHVKKTNTGFVVSSSKRITVRGEILAHFQKSVDPLNVLDAEIQNVRTIVHRYNKEKGSRWKVKNGKEFIMIYMEPEPPGAPLI